jgi:hypothetical protein
MEEYTGTEAVTIHSLSKERRRSRTKGENPSFIETTRLGNFSSRLEQPQAHGDRWSQNGVMLFAL